jgi:deoxyxylulose-5-phosphate synthase
LRNLSTEQLKELAAELRPRRSTVSSLRHLGASLGVVN